MAGRDMYKDFELYSRALIESNDVDPVYPLVRDIIDHYGFEPEWFVFCYVGFYSLESGIKMCKEMPSVDDWDEEKFRHLRLTKHLHHFNHERRGTCRNIDNQVNMFKRIKLWFEELQEGQFYNGEINNHSFRKEVMSLPFHGDWASYKIAELFEKSLGCKELEIPDLGLEGKRPNKNDGPVGGLRWLYGRDHEYTEDIFPVWNRFGEALAKAWGVDMGKVETCLCKWHKMMTGKYWVGHDVAEFIELEHTLGKKTYEGLMEKHFDRSLWAGMRSFPSGRKKVYSVDGEILNSHFAKKLPKIDVYKILMEVE